MLTVLLPENEYSGQLRQLLAAHLPDGSELRDPDRGLEGLAGRRLLFAVALDEGGCNESYYRMLSRLRRSLTLLHGCVAGLVVTGVGEFYTKDVARDMVFTANQAGCAFIGRPLVEATGSLRNFRTQAQIGGTDEVTAFHAALAELIASISKPSAAVVLGGGHSIGIPLAVSARRSFIVPTATMTVHPVRHSGMILGVPQTMRWFEQMQERITGFVAAHSGISEKRYTELMLRTGELVMDVGTVLDGRKAVREKLIDQLGGISDALAWLYREIER